MIGTDIEKIKELMGGLELPGEDDWRAVPHPEDAVEETERVGRIVRRT